MWCREAFEFIRALPARKGSFSVVHGESSIVGQHSCIEREMGDVACGIRGAVPKYTIRVGLIWLVPSISLLLGCFHLIPLLLAALLTPLEVPKAGDGGRRTMHHVRRSSLFLLDQIRAKLFGNRAKKLLPCLRAPELRFDRSILWSAPATAKVPALLRLSVLWLLQAFRVP